MAIILCDVDDVVLDLVTVWLEVWSSENGKLATKEQIKTWDIAKYTSPDIHKYLKEKDLYYPVEPIPGAVKSITYLKNLGHRVIFATMSHLVPSH